MSGGLDFEKYVVRGLLILFAVLFNTVQVQSLQKATGQGSKRYREFVETGLAESDDDFKLALKLSPRSIGSDGFGLDMQA